MDHSQDPGVTTLVDSPARTPARRPAKALSTPTTPMEMLALAVQNGASVEQLGQLMDLKDRHEQGEARKAFVAAMAQFKKNPPRIEKNRRANVSSRKGEGASYAYKYANLADVCEQIVTALADVGISHDWSTEQKDGFIAVTCTLTHELGHSKSTRLVSGADQSGGKNSLQALGSAVSYLERYTLLAATGLAVDDGQDDDGDSGITGDERAELRQEADKMRAGRTRQSPQEIAGQRTQKQAPGQSLIDEARAKADMGHKEFGAYWRGLTDDQRTQLGPMLQDLSDRASAATAQRASEAGK